MDLARISDAHLTILIRNALAVHGVNAVYYAVEVFQNGYSTLNPERINDESEPIGECKVLLSKPLEGMQLSDFISLTDKIETEYKITTLVELTLDQILKVTFRDNKPLHLRVVACNVYHAQSTAYWFYTGVVI